MCDINVQWVKGKEKELHANRRLHNIDTKKFDEKHPTLQILYQNLLNNFITNSVCVLL